MSLAEGDNRTNAEEVLRGDRHRLSDQVGHFVDEHNVIEAQAEAYGDLVFPIAYEGGMLFRDGTWIKDDKTHFLGSDIPNKIFWQHWRDNGGIYRRLPKCLKEK